MTRRYEFCGFAMCAALANWSPSVDATPPALKSIRDSPSTCDIHGKFKVENVLTENPDARSVYTLVPYLREVHLHASEFRLDLSVATHSSLYELFDEQGQSIGSHTFMNRGMCDRNIFVTDGVLEAGGESPSRVATHREIWVDANGDLNAIFILTVERSGLFGGQQPPHTATYRFSHA